jgi:two-component sensor histidine kinase
MSKHSHMPPVPPANRSHKGTGDNSETANEKPKLHAEVNTQEQGDTANPGASSGLGMKIIQSFARQIGGKLRIGRGDDGRGPRFSVLFSGMTADAVPSNPGTTATSASSHSH